MPSKTKKGTKNMPVKKPATKSVRRPVAKKPVTKKSVRGGSPLLPKFKFNKLTAGILIVLFAGIGSYLVYRSFAAAGPPAGGYLSTLAPGSALPSDAECAQRVNRSAWEPRPENQTANQTLPGSFYLPGFVRNDGGVDNRSRAYADRVTGNFKGTTDEIIQWAACKWGFSDEIVRAVAVTESYWKQAALGDYTNDQTRCQVGYTAPCPESFGLLQVKATAHRGTFPYSRDSTAFSIDYSLMSRRICYEGWVTWLYDIGYSSYTAGDEWGCVGHWYSGGWYDAGANNYINTVKGHFTNKPWHQWQDSSVMNSTGNLAKGKTVTTNSSWSSNLPRVTDGVLTSGEYSDIGSGPNWFSVDLGQNHDVGRIRFWHYYADSRIYKDVIVQLSSTPDFSSNVHTVFNNDTDNTSGQGAGTDSEYAEHGNGKDINFATIGGMRYVRLWSNGSSSNAGNHMVEAEVYAAASSTDTAAPSVPSDLKAIPQSSSQINLSWTASTDNVGVTGYDVYRGGAKLATVATNSFSDTGLAASTTYSYYVVAQDAAGNSSPSSNMVSAATQATTQPTVDTASPLVSIGSPANGSTIGRSVSVKASATDNIGVTKMEVYIDGSLKATSTSGSISYGWNSRKARSGAHTITVKAYDAAGNASQSSVTVYK